MATVQQLVLDALKKTHTKYSRKIAIFGIDEYQIGPEASLAGCKNDAYDIANTLRYLGWPASGIHVITDKQATTDRWYKEMAWLRAGAGPGDVRAYVQSSHGTNKWDASGDEPDRLDEMPVFHNFSWDDESTHITDDNIRKELVEGVDKACKLDIVLDTCHSGTGARSLFGRSTQTKSRYLPNPDQYHIINRMYARGSALPIKWFGNSAVDREIVGDAATYNNGTLYACLAGQVAYETAILVNGQWQVRGLMTYNLCNVLRETTGIITRKDLGQEIAARVAGESDQIPGYECSNTRFENQIPFMRMHQDEIGEIF